MPDVSCLIVNWNTCEPLARLLGSIPAAVGRLKAEVVVVDNASTDGSAEMVLGRFASVRLIRNERNAGYTGAANQALAAARSPFLLLLNGDVELLPGSVERAVEFHRGEPRVAVVGVSLRSPDGSPQASCARFPSVLSEFLVATGLGRRLISPCYPGLAEAADGSPRDVDWIVGCFMLLRREAVDDVGGMDEAFWMYSEDTDWCFRFARRGWRIVQLPAEASIHEGGASTRQNRTEMQVQLNRGKLRFFAKHFPASRTVPLRALLAVVYAARAALYHGLAALSRGELRSRWREATEVSAAVAGIYRKGPDATGPGAAGR